MDDPTARAIARELLAIQLGSAEDAKNLLDSTLTNEERETISWWIDELSEPSEEDVPFEQLSDEDKRWSAEGWKEKADG